MPFSLAAVLATGGRVAATGEVVRAPAATRLHAELAAVALPPLAALARSPLRLESGNASGALDIAFGAGGVEASATLVVADVKTISPDPVRPEDVLAWKEARLALRQARSAPPSAAFEKVEVDWPYVLVDRSAGGIFPFSLAAPAAPASAEGAPLPTVRIDALRVRGARIDFRDATLTPPYWRALANLGLEARAVEAPAVRVAELRADGLVDELSPLSVEGTIGARTHLVAQVERLALPPFNAYLEGASPYTVSSGAVSGKSEITLERSELEVNNQVVLSRLGLSGEPGEDFVKRQLGIPLTLALALMKDYRGDIALALPFGGNVSEPSFSVAHVLGSHPDLAIRLHGLVGGADAEHLRDEAALARASEPLRAFLRARLAGSPAPPLDDAQRARLDALRAGVPWPDAALHDLAVDRGAVVAAALILEHRLDPGRVSVDTPPTPGPERLVAAPGVAVEVYERQ